MAVTWGEAEVILHTDGRALPGEVRAATTAAATEGGQQFQKVFKKEMRKAAVGAVKEFASPFIAGLNRLMNNRLFLGLRRQLRFVQTDFRILGNFVKGTFQDSLRSVQAGVQNTIRPFREFRQEIGERSAQAVAELREGLSHLKISADDVRKTFPGLAKVFDTVRGSIRNTADSFRVLGNRFHLIRQSSKDAKQGLLDFKVAMENLRIDSEGNGNAFSNLTKRLGGFTAGLRKNNSESRKFFSTWKRMPHGLRQFIVWTTAILSGLEQMAVLGSAAGGGLLILLGAFTQFGIGVGATIAVFQDLGEELEKLPAWLRPAAAAFQGIGDAFGRMQDFIQKIALKDAVADFEQFEGIVDALTTAFAPLAEVIGNAISGISNGLKPGTKAFEELYILIVNSAPTFEGLLDVAGKLGGALLDAFSNKTMQKAIEGLVGWMGDLVESFATFVESDSFVEWIENSMGVLEDFGGLLEGIGEVLEGLVDDESVVRTRDFLTALTDSLPGIQALLEALGALDVFGLLAEAIDTVMTALRPFLEILTPIIALISDGLVLVLDNARVAWDILYAAMLPVRVFWETITTVIGAVIDWIKPFTAVLEELGEQFVIAADTVWNALQPAIEDIGEAITDMLPSPEEFERFIRVELIPTLQDITKWIVDNVVPAIQDFADWMRDEGVPAAKKFWEFVNQKLLPLLTALWDGFTAVIGVLVDFGNGIIDMVNTIRQPIQNAIGWFQSLFGAAQSANSEASKGGGGGGFSRALAAGSILTGPTRILAGEAGAEAIVPLNRPLSMVDPSVRWLSAIAQGKTPAMASGGVVGGGRSVTIAPGAIVVQGDTNPARTAVGVLNRIAERLG